MRRYWTALGAIVAISSSTFGSVLAQEKDNREGRGSSRGEDRENEVRLRYDDDEGRLSIDVDEDIRFRDDNRRREVVRDGKFDLRYDTDEHELRAAGEGTVDVDRAASQMARWWQSWWDEERQARRGRNQSESSQIGAREFIREHDDDNDTYLTQQELPSRMRSDFDQVDRNDDGYLSRTEVQRYGQDVFDVERDRHVSTRDRPRDDSDRTSVNKTSGNKNDQTWSQWWSSWWSENQSSESGESGARQLIRNYDNNDDGYLTRRELPQRMRDDFAGVDRNDDDYLSRTEIRNHGDQLRVEARESSTRTSANERLSGSKQDDQTWSEWWSSWWSEESSGQSNEQIATSGAREFIRRHDRNDDGYLTRHELPQRMRDDFAGVDRNDDGYLSRTEIRNHGDQLRAEARESSTRTSANERLSGSKQDDQTWSEWWSSWWSEESSGQSNEQIATSGAREFIRRHDRNDDGYLVRSEMPRRMYDEFQQIDANDDRYLSRNEVRDYASKSNHSRSRSGDSSGQAGARSPARNQSTPAGAAYVWVIGIDHDHADLEDLQEAYEILSNLDGNSDGKISQEEFEQRREKVVTQFCEKCFDKLDEDGDDKLSQSEARNSMFSQNFDDFDRDGNEKLTKSEVRQTIEKKVGSQSSAARSSSDEGRRE